YITDFSRTVGQVDAQDFTAVTAVKKSQHDLGFTYNTSQFTKWKFNPGDEYIFVHANGAKIEMTASRGGGTLYAKGLTRFEAQAVRMPEVSAPVEHQIVAVFK